MKGKLTQDGSVDDLFPPVMEIAANEEFLKNISLFALLNYLNLKKLNGRLTISTQSFSYSLFIQQSSIIAIEKVGVSEDEALVSRLVRTGVVKLEDIEKIRKSATESGKPLMMAMYESGLISPRSIVDAIRANKEEALLELLFVKSAEYLFEQNAPLPKKLDPVKIELGMFLVKHIRERTKNLFAKDIEPFLRGYIGKYPVKSALLTPLMEGVALLDKERRVLNDIVDGSLTLKEVFTISILSSNLTSKLFLMLTLLGFVEYRERPVPKGGVEVFEKELEATYNRMKGEDHFVRLSIHWTVHPSQIVPAFESLQKKYGKNSPTRNVSPLCAEYHDKIMKLIEESFAVVADKKRRNEYRHALLGPAKLKFGAEFLYKQAHLSIFRGDIEKGRALLESAIDIMPNDEYTKLLRQISG